MGCRSLGGRHHSSDGYLVDLLPLTTRWQDATGLLSFKAKALNANADLDRGYEAALLIQSLELEYYGDRPIRPDLEALRPGSVQATVLRKFRLRSTSVDHRLSTSSNIGVPSSTPGAETAAAD